MISFLTSGRKSANYCWKLPQTSAVKNEATGKMTLRHIPAQLFKRYVEELMLWYEKELKKKVVKNLTQKNSRRI